MRFRLLLGIPFSLLLAGCVSVNQNITLQPNGEFHQINTIDFSQMAELLEGLDAESEEGSESPTESCETLDKEKVQGKNAQYEVLSASCTLLSEYVVESTFTYRSRGTDTYDKTTLPDGSIRHRFFLNAGMLLGFESEEESVEDLTRETLEAVYTFTTRITMPGRITNTAGGNLLRNNTVEFTNDQLLDMVFTANPVYVESMESAREPVGADMQARVCKRVEKFTGNVLKRVQERIKNRFGFVCGY